MKVYFVKNKYLQSVVKLRFLEIKFIHPVKCSFSIFCGGENLKRRVEDDIIIFNIVIRIEHHLKTFLVFLINQCEKLLI